MKLSYNWISEKIDRQIAIEEMCKSLIASGTAVEGYEKAAGFSNVVVGKILECKDHENSDHLHVCSVDVGEKDPIQIVCGAANVKAGILVPVALVGATMPDGYKIKKGKLRGVESFGMICSGPELNIPSYLYPHIGDEGILIFNQDYKPGTDVAEILHLDDYIVDFDILANRPDCLCINGISAEVAASCKANIQKEENNINCLHDKINNYIDVTVENTELCPRYYARVVKNIVIEDSPLWLKAKLHKSGIRSINNIVDITNYIMIETGHPMHAFDLSKLKDGKIIVRNAKDEEKIKTLDDKEYTLNSKDLIIADSNKAIAIAGIMGGQNTEIDSNTKDIVFECACFEKSNVRKTARRLGIRTESSGRFEKGVNPKTVEYAINRACQLVNLLNCGEVIDDYIDILNVENNEKSLTINPTYIENRIGIKIELNTIIEILNRLGFTTKKIDDTIEVIIPSHRSDIENQADISEEIIRLYGFEHIPSIPLEGSTTQGGLSPKLKLKNTINSYLTGFGFVQAMNYSFISKKALEKLELAEEDKRLDYVELMNPLGEDSALMRTTLVPSMLQTAAININKGNHKFKIFENANVYFNTPKTSEGLPKESNSYTLIAYGENIDFFYMRNICTSILNALNINYSIKRHNETYLHPGKTAKLVNQDKTLMVCGEIHPETSIAFGIGKVIYIVEMYFDNIYNEAYPKYSIIEPGKFPAVERDLAIIIDERQEIGELIESIKKTAGNKLESIEVFDIYRGKQIADGKKSVAFNFVFRDKEKTLTADEVQITMSKIYEKLYNEYNANIRE